MKKVKTSTFTHLSLSEYINKEARECKALEFPYEMYVGYMGQWDGVCEHNIIMDRSDYEALEIKS
tara:strand:+ start:1458 stop:1652 length:195 start_codon:yes stop_codon:yes gene_type:complete